MVFEDITSVNCKVISYGFWGTLRQSNVRLFPMVFENTNRNTLNKLELSVYA